MRVRRLRGCHRNRYVVRSSNWQSSSFLPIKKTAAPSMTFGTADPAPFLGPDHAHPGDAGMQAISDALVRLGVAELQ